MTVFIFLCKSSVSRPMDRPVVAAAAQFRIRIRQIAHLFGADVPIGKKDVHASVVPGMRRGDRILGQIVRFIRKIRIAVTATIPELDPAGQPEAFQSQDADSARCHSAGDAGTRPLSADRALRDDCGFPGQGIPRRKTRAEVRRIPGRFPVLSFRINYCRQCRKPNNDSAGSSFRQKIPDSKYCTLPA